MSEEHQYKLGNLINSFLGERQISGRYQLALIKKSWEEWMGATIAARTTEIRLFGQKLVVSINSSALRQELDFNKEQLISIINEGLGKNYIREIEIR